MTCPQCGFENPPQMRFCGNCGAALAVTAARASEERKLVTVLFADVVGSTKLSSNLDSERLHDMMTRFFDIAREEIERYGGTVEKFIGDAVMAVFGLPAIHEDDPERAARAAIAMRDRARPQVEAGTLPPIRIGVNTGEVVANPRAFERGEFIVTGEMVNLAARLQQHAESGQILLGERTMQAVRQIARLEPVPPIAVKGPATPVPAWALIDIQPPGARELRATPFVGREEELALLEGHLRRMLREGRGHIVTILGPAGVGKTRLAREFRLRAADVRTLSGRAVPYGTGVPFWALGEAIRDQCSIQFGDSLEIARGKLIETTTQLEVSEAIPALFSLLGLGAEKPGLTREALFTGMRAFFQALTQRSPTVLIVEDLHLAEDVTLDFLEQIADWIRDTSLMTLVLSRPELLERRSTWMGGKRSATTIFLDPLGGEESRELTEALLGGKPGPQGLLDLVLQRAEGNPLFLEEMLRVLVERGVLNAQTDRWHLSIPLDQITIPDTVHAVIAARVDALPGHEKQVLQAAALQGKDFWMGGLHQVTEENHTDEAIRVLVDKELLVPKRRSSLAGEAEFTFRHILIRDVAYASIPKSQRWPKHLRVAEWMEDIMGDRRPEFADIIAHHWLQVLALRRELGLPLEAKTHEHAITNLLIAGDRAAGLYANTTALDHYSRVLELGPEPAARMRALLGRGEVWMLLGEYDRAREDFDTLRELSQETGQRRWEAVALDHLGMSFRMQDQIANALEHLESALELSRDIGDPALSGRILNHIGFSHFSASRHEQALRAHEEARQLLAHAGDQTGLAESLHGLGENLMLQGRIREGLERLSASAQICEQIGNRPLAGENRYMMGYAHELVGEYGEAQMETAHSLATLEEIGASWNASFAHAIASDINSTLGEFGKALDHASRGLHLARQVGGQRAIVRNLLRLGDVHREMENYQEAWRADSEADQIVRGGEVAEFTMPAVLAGLALDALGLERVDEARVYADRARETLGKSQTVFDHPQQVTYTEGRVLLARGKPDDAINAVRELLGTIESTGTVHWRLPASLLEAEARLALGESNSAARIFRAAAAEAERQGRQPAVWRALAGLAEALWVIGEQEEARASARQARAVIDRLAATINSERQRATFLQSALVQRVNSLAGMRQG